MDNTYFALRFGYHFHRETYHIVSYYQAELKTVYWITFFFERAISSMSSGSGDFCITIFLLKYIVSHLRLFLIDIVRIY